MAEYKSMHCFLSPETLATRKKKQGKRNRVIDRINRWVVREEGGKGRKEIEEGD